MQITNQEIRAAFEDLLREERPREEIARWAASLRAAEDAGELGYVPPSAERAMRDALEFLVGVDLKDDPERYLHNNDDIAKAMGSFLECDAHE